MRILVVEDAPRLRENLGKALTKSGFAVDLAADRSEALDFTSLHRYDVIILDRMLPDCDGLSILAELRQNGDKTPVLVLTALDAVDEKVRGFSHGADDYLTKPFAIEELVARIEALARRQYGRVSPSVKIGNLEVDLAAKKASLHGNALDLKAREFAVLACLAQTPGRVLSRIVIEEQVYGESNSPMSNTVDAAICSIRKALGESGRMLQTRRGLGYVLEQL